MTSTMTNNTENEKHIQYNSFEPYEEKIHRENAKKKLPIKLH